jgi:hypothetical protein
MKRLQNNISMNNQRGAAFILFFVLLVVGFGIFFLQTSSTEGRNNEAQTRKALLEAKEALIGFAVSTVFNVGTNNDMGRLPWPDRRNDAPNTCPGRYDGRGDYHPTLLGLNLMLGKLPWWNDPLGDLCIGTPTTTIDIGLDIYDGSGERLWYAVSPYLVRSSNTAQTAFEPAALNDPLLTDWLTVVVHDSLGNTTQTIPFVAFVLIAPGSPINGQIRNGVAPLPNRYLESSNGINNFDTNTPFDFVMAPKSDTFNDVLVYVTREELVAAVYQRVFNEVRIRLNNFYNTSGVNYYPYPGDNAGECSSSLLSGSIAITDSQPATPDCGGTNGIIAALPAYINNNWTNDITYTVNNNCVQSSAIPNCNTIPGVVQLSSATFPNIRAQLP